MSQPNNNKKSYIYKANEEKGSFKTVKSSYGAKILDLGIKSICKNNGVIC
ncbi:MAG: hypothetical protein KC550_02760 [Nanoarchaeota archaeon]|nr:hypothetical protein [Nanoarchaeota archaeon]